MTIAAFGSKVFRVSANQIYTFDNFTRSRRLNIDTQNVQGKKPSTYIEGPGLDDITISVSLKASLGVNVELEIKAWESILNSMTPQIFTVGGTPLSQNKFLLKSINENEKVINNKGKVTEVKLELSFEEFVRPGKPPEQNQAAGKEPTTKFNVENVRQWEREQANKRNNTNARTAVLTGPTQMTATEAARRGLPTPSSALTLAEAQRRGLL